MSTSYRPNFQVLKYVYNMINDEKRKTKDITVLNHFNTIIDSICKIGYDPDFTKRELPRFKLERNQKSVPLPEVVPPPSSE